MAKRKRWTGIVSTALCALVLVVVLMPFVIMLLTSLKSMNEIMQPKQQLLPKEWLFSNFREAMSKGTWGVYFKNSLILTVSTVVISLITNSLAGYAFARIPFKGRDALFFVALIGMMVPSQITMIPTFIMLNNFPLAGGNDIFGNGGVGLINTYAGIILPYIAGAFGVFLCRQYFLNFPVAMDDAAKIDGCGRLGAYVRIYLPLAKPILGTLAVLKASQTWNEYLWPLIMTNKDSMKTVQLAVVHHFVTETQTNWPLLMAATTIIILPLLVLFMFCQRYFVEGVVSTGIKN